jgi:glycosyltransferase involved in cell wall biosynthesis
MQAPAGQPASPRISVVIPVYNSAGMLRRCLAALASTHGVEWECIVVDDGSTDASASIARDSGARVIRSGDRPAGPARARNLGAQAARADLLCFVDADVCVQPETLAAFVRLFDENADLAAAFGSYDDRPGAQDFYSQYRNLLHHFVHQRGSERASTFWSGCGAVRSGVFLANGGFDAERYPRPCIEDIDLGVRLAAGGNHIRLAKHIQVTHLKRWTLRSIIATDVRDRAVPWTRLIMRTRSLPNDLNLGLAHRASALCVYLLAALVGLGCWSPLVWSLIPAPVGVLLVANHELYALFVRRGGLWFAIRASAMHWLYFVYSSAAFVYGTLTSLSTDTETGAAGRVRPADLR